MIIPYTSLFARYRAETKAKKLRLAERRSGTTSLLDCQRVTEEVW